MSRVLYEWALICLYAETVTSMRIGKGRVRKIQPFKEQLLGLPDAARILGLSRYELRSMAYREEINFRYVSGNMMFSPADLEKHLSQRTTR